jgi:hypothetical protein
MPVRRVLLRQLQTAWQLTHYHLDTLSTEECLWRPAPSGPSVARNAAGAWVADWPTITPSVLRR